jgi:hypothetical protein
MARSATSPKHALDTVLPRLGSVLEALYAEGQRRKPGVIPYPRLMQEMPGDTDAQEAILMGALAVLRGMGLICVDAHGNVSGISRYAYYALGSLSRFLSASVPVADKPMDKREQDYLLSLTKALESMRVEKAQVNEQPLHSRRIVNVLIKSRQIRDWRVQDVYLHVYHPEWKQYHLVGLSHKDDSKTDEEIAGLALKLQVGLMPDQYSLDPAFNPREIKLKRISATSGALTEYTFRLMAVKRIRVKLRLRKLISEKKFDRDWFRWFTWEEIKQRESEQGEAIMFSTPLVMEEVDPDSIPFSAPGADDVRRDVRIGREFGNRFSYEPLIGLAVALVLVTLLKLLPHVFSWLGRPSTVLTNLASIAEILGVVITLGGILAGRVRKSWK